MVDNQSVYGTFTVGDASIRFDMIGDTLKIRTTGEFVIDRQMMRVLSAYLEDRWRSIDDRELYASYLRQAGSDTVTAEPIAAMGDALEAIP